MKKQILTLKLVFLLCFGYSTAYCQTDMAGLKNVVSKLKNFSSVHTSEKTYLHFDKPYYAAGDTIYFKAYITYGERHQPSELSGVLHVELINTNNKIDQSIKLPLNKGISWGDFALPDSLPKGNYRVRAYTQWMRNDGSYFEQVIPIGSAKNDKIPENSTAHKTIANAQLDLQFFPEGGELVEGMPSKVAFKAIGPSGLGVDVNGVIIDNAGQEVSKFTSTHLGMGYFYLVPASGKIYRAKLTYTNGKQTFIDLPQVNPKGIVLKINNDSLDRATVQLVANESYLTENRGKSVSLLIHSAGLATTVTVRLDSLVTDLTILKRRLHAGITRITLFSTTSEPISERLVFIEKPDQLNLTLSGGKIAYNKREKVSFNINTVNRADSAVVGHLSVSVINEGKVSFDENAENTICNYLLLTSDLKGYIEQPNYYFTHINDKARADLDLVMLTHGYRRFEWKQLLNEGYPPVAWQPERNLEIAGMAKGVFGKPLTNGTVSLISMQGGPYISAKTDSKGRFRFSNLVFEDTAKFILQAVNAKGKNSTQLTYDKELAEPLVAPVIQYQDNNIDQSMFVYLENKEKEQQQLNNLGLGKGRALREVHIKARKNDEIKIQPGYGIADQVVRGDQIIYGGQLAVRLMGLLHGVHFVYDNMRARWIPVLNIPPTTPGSYVKIFVNQQEMPEDFDISSVGTDDVEKVESFINSSVPGGAIFITRTFGKQAKNIEPIGVLPITANGFHKAREFYSPKYEHPETTNRKDLRTTIYWKPEIVTDKDGNASFEYYNADGTGTYRVVIEGIDDKGDIGRQVYRYKVE
ncbi:MAG TPA: hypothetical protein VK668_23865 [Mucilaginibacter sp.]|nr:hypothetical protein [Mucilaginibacter sp.]